MLATEDYKNTCPGRYNILLVFDINGALAAEPMLCGLEFNSTEKKEEGGEKRKNLEERVNRTLHLKNDEMS